MKNKPNFTQTNLRKAKILIIEDNDDQWQLMQQIMQTSMSKVAAVRVASREHALSLLEEWRYQEWEMPQLILLDLYLPMAEEGWHVLKHIKDMDGFMRLIPIVMLTNSNDTADIAQAYKLGVSAYTLKPVKASDWQTFFELLRTYWWETASLPFVQYGL